MKKCVIFCAGGFSQLLEPLEASDLIIAADGGLKHLERLGIKPHYVLGDFDSLGYTPAGAMVFPERKDDTDAMLAVRLGLEAGCGAFVIYGALDGDRLEHTVANFQTLAFLAQRGARGHLVGLNQIATVIFQERRRLPIRGEGYVSLFCLGAAAEGVTLEGLEYSLTDGVLTPDFPLGVSNRFRDPEGAVTVRKGMLLAIWDRPCGLSEI